MTKRDIVGELFEGTEAMRKHREGKLTLRTHKVASAAPPPVDAKYIRATREMLRMSAQVFARSLRVRPRTLERWEQGQAPGDAASVLIGLVRRYPETLKRIAGLEAAPARRKKTRSKARRRLSRAPRKAARRPKLT